VSLRGSPFAMLRDASPALIYILICGKEKQHFKKHTSVCSVLTVVIAVPFPGKCLSGAKH